MGRLNVFTLYFSLDRITVYVVLCCTIAYGWAVRADSGREAGLVDLLD